MQMHQSRRMLTCHPCPRPPQSPVHRNDSPTYAPSAITPEDSTISIPIRYLLITTACPALYSGMSRVCPTRLANIKLISRITSYAAYSPVSSIAPASCSRSLGGGLLLDELTYFRFRIDMLICSRLSKRSVRGASGDSTCVTKLH
jgi:hypothetical protein